MLYENHHEAIISYDVFKTVETIINENRRYDTQHAYNHHPWSDHIFRGLIYCEKCGRHMNGIANRRKIDKETGEEIRQVVYKCPGNRTGDCENPTITESRIGEIVANILLNLSRAKQCFSSFKHPLELEQAILSGIALNSVEALTCDSLNGIWDTLRRFKTDESFKIFDGQPGRQSKKNNPEIDNLLKERTRMHKKLARLDEAYYNRVRSMSIEEYKAKSEELVSNLAQIDAELGRVREIAPEKSTIESVYKEMHKMESLVGGKRTHHAVWQNLIRAWDSESIRDVIEGCVDSIRIKDGFVSRIVLLDGTSISLTYDKNAVKAYKRRTRRE